MKVFISWSGEESKAYAAALDSWLPKVAHGTQTWISTVALQAGIPSLPTITSALSDAAAGIICITPSGAARPWLNFEAGALSQTVAQDQNGDPVQRRVMPLLFGYQKVTDFSSPLTMFQCELADEQGVRGIVHSLYEIANSPFERVVIDEIFDTWWPKLQISFATVAARHNDSAAIEVRPDSNKLDEVLQILREMKNQANVSEGYTLSKSPDLVFQRSAKRAVQSAIQRNLLRWGVELDSIRFSDDQLHVVVQQFLTEQRSRVLAELAAKNAYDLELTHRAVAETNLVDTSLSDTPKP